MNNFKGVKISWSIKKAMLIQTSIRKRIDWNGKEQEYAVFHIIHPKEIDHIQGEPFRKRRQRKFMALMCFDSQIFGVIRENLIYSFSGEVTFGYGSTFFCVEKCFDMLGFPLESNESVVWSPFVEDEEIPF